MSLALRSEFHILSTYQYEIELCHSICVHCLWSPQTIFSTKYLQNAYFIKNILLHCTRISQMIYWNNISHKTKNRDQETVIIVHL